MNKQSIKDIINWLGEQDLTPQQKVDLCRVIGLDENVDNNGHILFYTNTKEVDGKVVELDPDETFFVG